MDIIVQIFGVIAGFSFLIFVHEFGHFLIAKMCKIRILTFAFGFGPDVIKYVYKDTKYCLKSIPLGGFVEMAGENPQEITGASGEYLSLQWYKKIFISLAGSISNYIMAFLFFIFIFNTWGVSTISTDCSIGSVVENYPAAIAGLKPKDKILSVNGININTWDDLVVNLKDKVNRKISFVVRRGDSTFALNMIVVKNPETRTGVIGVNPAIIKEKVRLLKSAYLGAKFLIFQTTRTIVYLANKIISLEKPDVTGPIGVLQVMLSATKAGMQNYLSFIALVSVALGLFNLFPLPLLDGGMVVLLFIEGIIGKKMSTNFTKIYNIVGLVFIISVFLFVTYNDFLKLGVCNLFKE
ncbi:MAG: site-2 protease family protein [Endomicrobium sp.]|jgi:regulator of sigma E protease|nr:site-2 protease family protein [Endomicrobium sp.]